MYKQSCVYMCILNPVSLVSYWHQRISGIVVFDSSTSRDQGEISIWLNVLKNQTWSCGQKEIVNNWVVLNVLCLLDSIVKESSNIKYKMTWCLIIYINFRNPPWALWFTIGKARKTVSIAFCTFGLFQDTRFWPNSTIVWVWALTVSSLVSFEVNPLMCFGKCHERESIVYKRTCLAL